VDNKKLKSIPEIKALIFMKAYSERLPRKNMKKLCGRPLFHWILDTLSESIYINEIIINTDSKEIAESASKNYNVTIHERPEYLNNIESNEANQIIEYDLSKTNGQYFFQSHSTNPLLSVDTVDKAIEEYFFNKFDSLISVTEKYKRYFTTDGIPINHNPKNLAKTQNCKTLYEENSCIYIFSREVFEKNINRIGNDPLLYPISPIESIDIDEPIDFEIAEFLMQRRNNMPA
jgi:CMP-N-acetylneuraminic acid synthetase